MTSCTTYARSSVHTFFDISDKTKGFSKLFRKCLKKDQQNQQNILKLEDCFSDICKYFWVSSLAKIKDITQGFGKSRNAVCRKSVEN